MVAEVVDIKYVVTFEPEDDTPVAADIDGVEAAVTAAQVDGGAVLAGSGLSGAGPRPDEPGSVEF